MKKETFEQAGYKMVAALWAGECALQNPEGQIEVWCANKNHASYGLIYRNTHLEFARSATAFDLRPIKYELQKFRENTPQ